MRAILADDSSLIEEVGGYYDHDDIEDAEYEIIEGD